MGISNHKRLWEDQQRVGFQSMLFKFPTNTIVTRWPRCATFNIEISYLSSLPCLVRFYLQWINAFGILDFVLHNSISCVKHMDFCFKFDDENWNLKCNPNCPKKFIHQNMFLLLKCINHLGKINYYLSHSNLESIIYLVNSEFV